jgi:hypothetical protein
MIWQQRKRHCGVLRLENLPREARQVLLIDVVFHCMCLDIYAKMGCFHQIGLL